MTQFDRDKLVTDNLRLVYYLYEKLTKNPLTENYKDDIISEGMVGLVKAANTFDNGRGIKFGTYASRCITNEMHREAYVPNIMGAALNSAHTPRGA